ncbi:MAG: xylose isomerase [Pedosphaera sp. Tous-C6FEB]|nr:MAG: xylose isomerase [Pedosphaera sp. Tous-C6FEB]
MRVNQRAPAMKNSFQPKLGFDNYALRSLGWKARQILDYAATLKLEAVLFSDFDVYESLADADLRDLKRRADDLGVALYAGMLSICPSSVIFDPRRGSAEEQLRLCLRIAKALGSPVARCVLGKVEDRRSPGGIAARIAETLAVLRAVRSEALDAGIKIAVENHAGDMNSTELIELIDAAGRDFVGATLDTGNALWALEEPLAALETLGPVTVCTGIRDSHLWETPEGATLQWTAVGAGLVDWPAFFRRFAELCPRAPVIIETISGRPIFLPLLRDYFWDAYPRAKPQTLAQMVRLARAGEPRDAFAPPPGQTGLGAEQELQLAELERSVRQCRKVFRALG